MTASQQAKAAGLKSLAEVSRETGVSIETLNNWSNNEKKQDLLEVVLLGVKAKKRRARVQAMREASDARWLVK